MTCGIQPHFLQRPDSLNPPMSTEIIKDIWNCTRNTAPITWALGDQHGDEMKNVRALVWRNENGPWRWDVGIHGGGTRPSRETAMDAADAALANALLSEPPVDAPTKDGSCVKRDGGGASL